VRRRQGWLLLPLGLVLGLGAGYAAWGGGSEASGIVRTPSSVQLTPVEAPVAGALAPAFEAQTVDGDPFDSSELRGHAVVLNFWATWCEPCRVEMPLLESRYRTLASSGLLVVGINAEDTPAQVQAYRDELGLTFPLLLDPGREIESLYRVRGYPTTFVVDRAGVLQAVHLGSLESETLDDYLRSMGMD
jgi:cytochrome c biogenesis protein CcmG, thiol:disulfide interchange protein DsbE